MSTRPWSGAGRPGFLDRREILLLVSDHSASSRDLLAGAPLSVMSDPASRSRAERHLEGARGLHVVVLAAGKGTRMKCGRPKVLHTLAGETLIGHVLRAARALSPETLTLVVGHQAAELQAALGGHGLHYALQEPQLGTGHAVLQAEPLLAGRTGTMVLLSGDVPLLRAATLERLVNHHVGRGAAATVLTACFARPYGYGRVLRHEGRITRIVEERDASAEQRKVKEINSGIYALAIEPLFDALRGIATENSQGEYYLPDLVPIYRKRGLTVETVLVEHPEEVRGVNSQGELAELGAIVREKRIAELLAAGVTIVDPATTYVDVDVEVGPDTMLHPNVYLEGRTRIGAACEIHAGARIVDSTVGDGAVVKNYSVVESSDIGPRASVGPFAHLRPGSTLGEDTRVGNFVELKKTTMGAGSKANHLAYLGDAAIGANVNVGAGTITCNYDGTAKHPTTIEDDVFIGSDTQLIAPVTVGRGAYVAAGSSITDDVPGGALAIARGRQVNKEGWAARKRQARG
jgi:bifunctional UDP-N-acetylglucosamine pyrophosphorylase / glucosamine-1-phosphate N-acetyltransferase